ncbi:hypothetical protein Ancab_028064 [Ancistrocladus abbreviatus]
MQSDAISFGTLAADTAPVSVGFPTNNDEFDLDSPSEGFSSIPGAIEDIRQGKIVVVVDDEDRENEGDLIMAASMVTPEAMAFIVKHGTGIICVSMKEEDLERLQLPLMGAKHGTTTGVSARDRATTILALGSGGSKPEDFNRPGHIFPLKYREGGVLKRSGHTEASVDLAVLAGLDPVAVLYEIVDDDGSMARLRKHCEFAQVENLKIISIADLIRYRRKRDKLVERASAAGIPTMWGPYTAYCYRSVLDGIEHIAMVKILRDLGVRTMKLMTNNPAKYTGLKGYGLAISGRVPLLTPITKENQRYLETKRSKMGHIYGIEHGSRQSSRSQVISATGMSNMKSSTDPASNS